MKLGSWSNKQHLTIGAELEIRLQNKKTLKLSNSAIKLKSGVKKEQQECIKEEFASSLLEIVTPICTSPKEATTSLKNAYLALKKVADKNDVALIATGVCPQIHKPLQVTKSKRYKEIEKEYASLIEDFSACGLHVHIGFKSSTKAIKAYNGMINYSPIFICLLANSPIFKEKDTGLLSYRLSMFDRLSRSGISPYFSSYKKMQKAYDEFFKSKTIKNIADIWWDLRINPLFGTLELRIGDSVHEIERIQAAIALFQALSLYFQKHKPSFLEVNTLMQNRWNAMRYGWDGNFYENKNYTYRDFAKKLIKKLEKEGVFQELNTTTEAQMLLDFIEQPNLAQLQREMYKKTKDIEQIIQFGELY